MSLWTRITNALSSNRLNRELNEEYEAHIIDAVASGRAPEEARRSFGPLLRHREQSRQHRVAGWLESIRIDLLFGLRQLKRNRITSLAAILSLGLAMGSCVSAFRLIDALMWRPLPISHPERLYALWHRGPSSATGPSQLEDDYSYAEFLRLRTAAQGQANLIAASYTQPIDLTYSAGTEMEKANMQYVSGSIFRLFSLKPTAGRLLTEQDDQVAAPPSAVISYAYWTRRFGRDPRAIGSNVRVDKQLFQIVGVADKSFTGVEPGTLTEIFLPEALSPNIEGAGYSILRIFAVTDPSSLSSSSVDTLSRQLEVVHRNFQQDRIRDFKNVPKNIADRMLNEQLFLEPASSGVSMLQEHYKRALAALSVLVVLVLLIACVNVANLMTAQAAARSQEMALRVSIGAGRRRLVQLVLAESALLAAISAAAGLAFAWWAAPFVAGLIGTPETPVSLALPADWRVALFAALIIVIVTLLFGLLPALRASSVRPVSALKGGFGGSTDPHARKRQMHAMIAAQVAFCCLVVFFAGIFVTSFQRLSRRPLGFDPDNLLILETISSKPEPSAVWNQVAESLQPIAGVESVATSALPLVDGSFLTGFLSVHGAPSAKQAFYLPISPGWLQTMRVQLLRGRDFRPSDSAPGVGIVSETFAKTFFPSEDALGQFYTDGGGTHQIIGIARDVAYSHLRETSLPIAYVPRRAVIQGKPREEERAILTVRLRPGASIEAITPVLRKAIPQAHAGFRVSNLRTQQDYIAAQTIRDRLLATLALFFAAVALLLAGVGLFGVLNYTVLQRRRELGIRLAVGARRTRIAALVARPIFTMIVLGAAIGLAAGALSARSIQTLFYATKATDAGILTMPAAAILSVAILAVIPAIRRAIQTDPAEILRSE